MVISATLLVVAIAQTVISCSLLSRMSSDPVLATQMEQEQKILKRVLYVFSGSFFVGFMTSVGFALLTEVKGEAMVIEEVCDEHRTLWTGFMFIWQLMMDQIPFAIIFWFNIRSFK